MGQPLLTLALAVSAAWLAPAAGFERLPPPPRGGSAGSVEMAAREQAAGRPSASAAEVRVLLPARELRSGQVVELRWDAPPPEVEELEILLSVDGGRHYGLRVTPQCEPGSGRFLWRVPNLTTGDARLRVRLGTRGREIEAEPSEPFAIVGETAAPAEPGFHENGWWSALDALPDRGRCGLATGEAQLGLPVGVRAAEVPPRDAGAPAPSAAPDIFRPAAPTAPSLPVIRPATHSRFAPLRE